MDEIAPDMPSPLLGSVGSFGSSAVVSGLSSGPLVVASRGSPLSRCVSPSGVPRSGLLVRRFRRRLGSHLGDKVVSGLWDQLEALLPVNAKELLAVRHGLPHFQSFLSGTTVAVFCDNVTAVAYLRKDGGTRSPALNAIAQEILCWAESLRIRLAPQFIPGIRNVLADSLPSSPAPQLRVVPQHGRISIFDASGAGDDRPICHLRQSPLLHLFLALPKPSLGGDGRASPVLGQSPGVHFSVVVHSSPGVGEASGVSPDPAHPHRPLLASGSMVRGPPLVVGGSSSDSFCEPRPPHPASVSSTLPGAPQAGPSCLETVQRFTRAAGFSSAVAAQAPLTRRPSSRSNYLLKWSVYRSWCRSQGHSISRLSLSKVADFLWWLRSVRGLSVSSIKGYRSLLSVVFKFHLPALSSHPVLRDLLRSFRVPAPSYPMRPPSWDLSKVLRFLTSDAFEPLRDAPLHDLSKKVLFLLVLATAKRVGELQALSRIVSFVGSDACLSYVPEFVAKSESLSRSIPRSFLVKSLSDFAAGLDDYLLLCPVRALRIYLDRTLSLALSRRRLFVSPSCPTCAMSKNAVSFFLRKVIHGAAASCPEVGSVRAYDIRGVSTSVAFHRNWSVSAVLDAATWSSSSVFTFFFTCVTFSMSFRVFARWVRSWLWARGSRSPHLFPICSGGEGGSMSPLSPLLQGLFSVTGCGGLPFQFLSRSWGFLF